MKTLMFTLVEKQPTRPATKSFFLTLLLAVVLFFQKSHAQLHIQSGATITTTNNAQITLDEISLDNAGNFDGLNSTLTILETNGSSNLNFGGTGTSTLNHLNIDLQTQDVLLTGDVTVEGDLTFLDGHFDLNANDLTLGTNGTLLGENGSSSIIGSTGGEVIKTVTLNAPTAVNPGNIGAEITSTANLGQTTIKRGHVPQTGPTGNSGISRHYDINPETNSGLDAALRFHYLDTELNGQTENGLELWRNDGSGWTDEGFTGRDVNLNYVELTGIGAFSLWTAADQSNALPVELLSFRAKATEEKTVQLSWQTASEVNNEGFEIQHSMDGLRWTTPGFVKGAGNTTEVQHYEFVHTLPLVGNNYYRLRQIDFDGQYEYSDIRSVKMEAIGLDISVYPNPANEVLHVRVPEVDGEVTVQLVDELGKLVMERSFLDNQSLNIGHLPKGVYMLKIMVNGQPHLQKVTVQ